MATAGFFRCYITVNTNVLSVSLNKNISFLANVRSAQNGSCNFYTHPRYQQVANVISVIILQAIKPTEYIGLMS